MHLSHFKQTDAGGVIAEALRLKDDRGELKVKTSRDGHVDLARVSLNYDLINRADPLAYYKERLGAVKVAKRSADLNTLSSTITYLPAEYLSLDEAKQRAFFETVTAFLKSHYGEENCLYACVHMDESRPHLHFGAIPVEHREAKVTKTGKVREAGDYLNCKGVDSRLWCSQLHTTLDKHLRSRLPWYKGGLMADDANERAKGSLELSAYREVKEAEKQVKQLKQEVAREANRIAYISTISNNTLPHSLPDAKRKAIEEGRGVKLSGADSTALRSLLVEGRKAVEQVAEVEARESAARGMIHRAEAREAKTDARIKEVNAQIKAVDASLVERERVVAEREGESKRALNQLANMLDDYGLTLHLEASDLAERAEQAMTKELTERGKASDRRESKSVSKLDDRIDDYNRQARTLNRLLDGACRIVQRVSERLTERLKTLGWVKDRDGNIVKPVKQERAFQSPSWTYWKGGYGGHER